MKKSLKAIIRKCFPFTVYIVRAVKAGEELLCRLCYAAKRESISYAHVSLYRPAGQKSDKIMFIAPPCSGKSTFARRKVYEDFKIIENLYNYWDKKSAYEEFRISFLHAHEGRICILDPFYNIHYNIHYLEENIKYVTIIPPKQKVIEYYRKRRKEVHYACILRDILEPRQRILSFAIKNNLPIYPNFETALDDMVERKYNEKK